MVQLRPHQVDAIADIYSEWKNYKNLLMVMPTGLGKSRTVGAIIKDKSIDSEQLHSTLIVHRKELVLQLSLMLCDFNIQHNVIVSTSDARRIVGEHLSNHKKSFYNPKSKVTVASVDTLRSRPERFKRIFDLSQLLIIDEAHHVLKDNKWGQVVSYFNNPNLKILGVTATPKRLDRKGLGIESDGIFEKLITTKTVQWGIDNKYLSKYKLVLPQNTPMLALKDKADYTSEELNKYVNENAIVGKTVENYIKFANGMQTIVFAATLQHGEQLLAEFKAHGIKAVFLHGDTNPIERFNGVKDFASNTIQVIINVDLFDEGFDCPAVQGRRIVECVIGTRPTMSLSKARQQWGRALRPADYKEYAIIIDQAGNVDRHGLPTKEIKWTLDRIQKSKAKELNNTKACYSCGAVNNRFAVTCEWCGTEMVNPESSGSGKPSSLKMVDGDLVLVDPDELDKMYKSTQLDSPQFMFDKVNAVAGYAAAMNAFKNQEKKIETQKLLADTIAKLYGYYKLDVKEDRELHKKLYIDFGVSMFDMLTSNNKEMLAFIENIMEFINENYT